MIIASNGRCYLDFILFHEPAASSGKHKEVSTTPGMGLFIGGRADIGMDPLGQAQVEQAHLGRGVT